MFVEKLKKMAAVVMAALVLASGVSAWRFAAAGSNEERKPVLPAPKADAAHAPKEEPLRPLPHASREFQIDLKVVKRSNGQEKLLAEPRIITLEGKPASFTTSAGGDSWTIDLGGGNTEEVVSGPSIHFVVRSGRNSKLRLDTMVSKPAQVILGDTVILESKSVRWIADVALGEKTQLQFALGGKPQSVLVISATIQEVKAEIRGKTVAEAERDLKMAENWQRKGHPELACGYYLQIVQTYPDTIYAERAKERLAELKKPKPSARVGQIFIRGNKKISDEVILKEVDLFPGQILTVPDLDIVEKTIKRVTRLKGVKQCQMRMTDREGDSTFKVIQITVEEK